MRRLVVTVVAALLLALPVAVAQDSASEKEQAKQARVEEYLAKKEQRRVEKEAKRQEKVQKREAEAEAAAAAAPANADPSNKLPRELAQVQAAVRGSSIGSDPTIQRYLTLIDQQAATAYQLAAFGNFVNDAGMPAEAEVYYNIALSLEQEDPTLWINYGTLLRQLGDLNKASSAYRQALTLNPNNALAHYNIGSVFDAQGKYTDALDAYSVALMLDPSLGDPKVNPSAANNQRLIAVKLMLYQQQVGTLGTPMMDVPQGALTDDPGSPDN